MPNPPQLASSPVVRVLWVAVGLMFVILGFVGAVVPVMPSTVFFVLASFCFVRGSERLHNWLLGLPAVGPLLRDYRDGLGMPRRAKAIAATVCAVAVLVSGLRLRGVPVKLLVLAIGALGIWYILQKVPTRETVLAERQAKSQP